MRIVLNKDSMKIEKEQDVVPFRNRVKEYAVKIGMSVVNQTKLITAASELVRNMLKYAGGGETKIEVISEGRNSGIRLVFEDKGPGIADIALAMKDGFSTGKSLGLGLPGTKRLVNEFDIKSSVGEGTIVTIIKWKNG
ncbi:putative anti-sigma regulatory factor, serine/threonine protein kinase [Niastella koreensis GR20-10]|uniref:Putative anti-sigma regulatory factor, serine/threonine protein kinase n=1 Tax=Niastella koreensis (strain DSM 17620 / KACC 11465 / NBRC 106392 / GR20-10) TaxID=700598 RepID=G8TD93_NIAKG|nr:anti-sigma regulatory factor [Niastella koreensis]AEV99333.1 putative anti-sigma regulatory factor, serine/threonine protein kinase [Niastella koreensis GR20-10]